jgi:hypothetical protein
MALSALCCGSGRPLESSRSVLGLLAQSATPAKTRTRLPYVKAGVRAGLVPAPAPVAIAHRDARGRPAALVESRARTTVSPASGCCAAPRAPRARAATAPADAVPPGPAVAPATPRSAGAVAPSSLTCRAAMASIPGCAPTPRSGVTRPRGGRDRPWVALPQRPTLPAASPRASGSAVPRP